tara:strand:- start:133 stop:399 length:267 start_codon:yes stop_codon:yes gene_type:complete
LRVVVAGERGVRCVWVLLPLVRLALALLLLLGWCVVVVVVVVGGGVVCGGGVVGRVLLFGVPALYLHVYRHCGCVWSGVVVSCAVVCG